MLSDYYKECIKKSKVTLSPVETNGDEVTFNHKIKKMKLFLFSYCLKHFLYGSFQLLIFAF